MDTARHEPDPLPAAPPARGVRLAWAAVPRTMRQQAGSYLAGRIVGAETQPGGFSPGAAVRLRLADGRRAFAKAVGPELIPDSPGIYWSEARIAARLPATVPAPRLLASFEDSEWVMLLFEDIDGRLPAQPWIPGELDRALDAVGMLAEELTPAPAGVDAPTVA